MKINIKKPTIAIGLFLYSLFAFADGGVTFQPVANDIIMQFLGVLFGNLGPISGGSGVFAGPIAIFNAIVMTFGGIVLSYMWVLGITRTGHSGTVLGDAQAQVGYPIKSTIGAVLVAPVFNSYSLIQIICATIIVSGIGAGDKMWSAYVSNQTDTMAQLSLNSIQTPARQYGYEKLKILACQEFGEKMAAGLADSLIPDWAGRFKDLAKRGFRKLSGTESSMKEVDNKESNTKIYNFGNNRCGMETYQKLSDVAWPNSNGKFTNPSNLASAGISYGSFNAYATNAAKTLETSLRTYAKQLANNEPVDGALIDQAIDTYIKSYRDEVLGSIKNSNVIENVSKSAADGGWASIATYYNTQIQIQTAISKALTNVPSATSYPGWIKSDTGDRAASKDAQLMLDNLQDTLSSTKGGGTVNNWRNDMLKSTGKDANKDDKTSLGDVIAADDTDKAIGSWVRDNLYSSNAFDTTVNGVTQSKALGERILGFLGYVGAAGIIAMAAASIIPGIAIAVQSAVAIIYAVALPPAFFLAYAVPLLPFMICVGVIFSFIVLALQGILLSQLWGLSFMMPGGDSILGTSHQGTKMVLNLALRPMLTVLGFIASIAILALASQWLGAVFDDVFAAMQSNSGWFSQMVGVIANWTLYGAALFLIIQKSVGLCASLPDACLTWLTGDSSTSSQNMGSSFGGAAAAAGGAAIGGKAAQGLSQAGGLAKGALTGIANAPGEIKEAVKSGLDRLDKLVGPQDIAEPEEGGGGESQSFSDVSSRNQSEGSGASDAAHDLEADLPTEQPIAPGSNSTYLGSSGVSNEQMNSIVQSIGSETGKDVSNVSDRSSMKDFIKANSSVPIQSADGSYKPASDVFKEMKASNLESATSNSPSQESLDSMNSGNAIAAAVTAIGGAEQMEKKIGEIEGYEDPNGGNNY